MSDEKKMNDIIQSRACNLRAAEAFLILSEKRSVGNALTDTQLHHLEEAQYHTKMALQEEGITESADGNQPEFFYIRY